MIKDTHCSILKITLNILLAVAGAIPSLLQAKHSQEITQPIGDLVRVWETSGPPPLPLQPPSRIPPFTPPQTPVEEVNYICAQWDFNDTPHTVSFDLNTAVTEIILTKPQHFLRMDSPPTVSGPNGPWMARSEYIRGLTPAQLKDRFALPYVPTNFVIVDLPASPDPVTGKDYALWTGIAAPIEGFGQGGGVQNRIMADFNGTQYFPQYEYVIGSRIHQQPIGKFALSYQPMAGKGNTHRIAAYLDRFIPEAYTDLEDVYTILDFLNYVNFGPDPLRQALNQLSPQDYKAVPFVITRNDILFGNAILDHYRQLRVGRNGYNPCCVDSSDLCCESDNKPFDLNIQAIGEFMKEHREEGQIGFNDRAGGLLGTFDFQPCNDFAMGISVAGIDNYLKWKESKGNAHIASIKYGLSASYTPVTPCPDAYFYLDGLVAGGYNWTKGHRFIKFPGVDREAHSRQTGYDVACHLQGGVDLSLDRWQFSPSVKASYFYVRENDFSERGAESLNLKVKGYDFQTLRSDIGLGIARPIDLNCTLLIPQIYAAWVHNAFIGDRSIRSRLKDLDSSFSVRSYYDDYEGFLGSASVMFQFANGFSAEGTYDLETDNHFISQRGKVGISWCF